MAINLTGKITDVTGNPPEGEVVVSVKAPVYRAGRNSIITSSPRRVDTDGTFTITVEPGPAWLYLEGSGWSDSVPISAAEGFTTIVQAMANAAGIPGLLDFIALLKDGRGVIDDYAKKAVDEAVAPGEIPSGTDWDTLTTRPTYVRNQGTDEDKNDPIRWAGVLYVHDPDPASTSDRYKSQTFISYDEFGIWHRARSGGGKWLPWQRLDADDYKPVNLGNASLDTVMETGYYAQPIGKNATQKNKYPLVGERVTVTVSRVNENAASQILQTVRSTNSGRVFIRSYVSGWNDWVEVAGGPFYRGLIDAGVKSIDELTPGNWGVGDGNISTALGLPENFGTLLIQYISSGKTALFQAQDKPGQKPALWLSSKSGDTWSEWTKVAGQTAAVDSAADITRFTVDTDGLTHEFQSPDLPADTTTPKMDAAGVLGWYDKLMAENPEYITKRTLGTASDGETPLVAYTFKRSELPTNGKYGQLSDQERTMPTCVLSSGTHGHEVSAVSNLYQFAKLLCNDWDKYPAIEAMRWNFEFVFIPMVNPYGFNGRGNPDVWSRKNGNKVDLNRNFPVEWEKTEPDTATWSGEQPLTEPESKAVWELMQEVKGRAILGIDMHNFSSSEASPWRQVWAIYSHPMMLEVNKALIRLLSRRWKQHYDWITVPDTYYGYVSECTGGSFGRAYAGVGIPGSTLETNNITLLDGGAGEELSARAMTLGLDTMVNHIRLGLLEGVRRKSLPMGEG